MSPERDSHSHTDDDYDDLDHEDEAPRSVFATTWFRAVLVVAVLAVVGVLALPYLLDWVGPTRLTPVLKGPVVSEPSPPRPAPVPDVAQPPLTTPPETPPAPPPSRATGNPPHPKAEGAPAAPTTGAGTSTKMARSTSGPSAPETAKSPAPEERMRTAALGDAHVAKGPAPKRPPKTQIVAATGGPYWVQVGAYHDEAHAKAVAAKLRGDNLPAEVVAGSAGRAAAPSAEPPAAVATALGDKYDVFVSGTGSDDVNTKISAKGLSAEPVAGGAVIKPSLSLRDAVSLSKDLAAEGMKVQVRRAAASPTAVQRPPAAAGDTVYRVRVGGFADRTAADEARKRLSARGINGFIGRGGG
jgi:cell division septation protein DedD